MVLRLSDHGPDEGGKALLPMADESEQAWRLTVTGMVIMCCVAAARTFQRRVTGGGTNQSNSLRLGPRPKRSEVPIRIPSIPHLLIPSPVTPTP